MNDLLALTASLVDIPSVSYNERAVADHLESLLWAVPWLETIRDGLSVVARTNEGSRRRLVLAGHTDTVPPNGKGSRLAGDTLWGRGSLRHEGRVGRAPRAGPHGLDPGGRRHLRVLLGGGGRADLQRRGTAVPRPSRPPGRGRRRAGGAQRCGDRGRVPGHHAGAPHIHRRAGAHRTGLAGEQRHPSHGWGAGRSLAAYEGRQVEIDGCVFREGSRPCTWRAACPGTSSPTRPPSQSATASRPIAAPKRPPPMSARCRRVARRLRGGGVRSLRPCRHWRTRSSAPCWWRPGARRGPSWAGRTSLGSRHGAYRPPTRPGRPRRGPPCRGAGRARRPRVRVRHPPTPRRGRPRQSRPRLSLTTVRTTGAVPPTRPSRGTHLRRVRASAGGSHRWTRCLAVPVGGVARPACVPGDLVPCLLAVPRGSVSSSMPWPGRASPLTRTTSGEICSQPWRGERPDTSARPDNEARSAAARPAALLIDTLRLTAPGKAASRTAATAAERSASTGTSAAPYSAMASASLAASAARNRSPIRLA